MTTTNEDNQKVDAQKDKNSTTNNQSRQDNNTSHAKTDPSSDRSKS